MISPSVWFGRVPPCRICGLRQEAQIFVQDVLRGVPVSVVYRAAGGAALFTDGQILCAGPPSTADRAELTGKEEAVYGDHLLAVPCRLVLQLL